MHLRKLFIKLAAINLLLSMTLLSIDANAQRRPNRPPPPPDFNFEDPAPEKIVLSGLNINVWGQQTIGVRKLVKQVHGPGLLKGLKLKRVIVRASAQSQRSKIALLINGVQVQAVRNIDYYPERIILDLPTSHYSHQDDNIIGQDIRSIQLLVKGQVNIKRIALKVENSYGHGGGFGTQVLRARNISLGSHPGSGYADQVSLADLLRVHGVNRKMVQEIRIKAIGLSRRAVLTITERGYGVLRTLHLGGRHSSYGSGRIETIHVGNNTPLSAIKMTARGNIQIKSLEVVVKQSRY